MTHRVPIGRSKKFRFLIILAASSDPKVLEEIGRNGVKPIFKKHFSVDDLTALIEKFRKNDYAYRLLNN